VRKPLRRLGRSERRRAESSGVVLCGESGVDERVDRPSSPIWIVRAEEAFDRLPPLVTGHDEEQGRGLLDQFVVGFLEPTHVREVRNLVRSKPLCDVDVELLWSVSLPSQPPSPVLRVRRLEYLTP
jgi:hypothetical protein